MEISYILDDLNDAQREAVTVDDRHALILSGAGSGKTRVLIHRIAWLIQVMKFSVFNSLAVTFTNKNGKVGGKLVARWLGIPQYGQPTNYTCGATVIQCRCFGKPIRGVRQ